MLLKEVHSSGKILEAYRRKMRLTKVRVSHVPLTIVVEGPGGSKFVLPTF